MGTRKTDADIRREDIADAINGRLLGTNLRVVAGKWPGGAGPYILRVDRLDREGLDRVIAVVLDCLGQQTGEATTTANPGEG
jgi:hypothetical protein